MIKGVSLNYWMLGYPSPLTTIRTKAQDASKKGVRYCIEKGIIQSRRDIASVSGASVDDAELGLGAYRVIRSSAH